MITIWNYINSCRPTNDKKFCLRLEKSSKIREKYWNANEYQDDWGALNYVQATEV